MSFSVNSVMWALYTNIASDTTVVNSNITVRLNDILNSNANVTPWVGIYFGEMFIEPRRIGSTLPWVVSYTPRIYMQETSALDATQAHDRLDRLTDVVLTAVNSDRTLQGTVLHMTQIEVRPFERQIESNDFFFSNELIITAEVDG